MPECGFCGQAFDEEHELHLHWGEEHEEELNSHQEEEMKKARREEERREQRKEEKKYRGREIVLYAAIGIVGLAVAGLIGSQLVQVHASTEQPTNGATAAGTGFNVSGEPVLGSENASVTVVEFGDYRCPFCRQFEMSVVPRLKQEFVSTGEVRFVFMNFPFLGEGSFQAAVASECVYRQDEDQFWPFHRAIYEHQGPESQRWVTQAKLMQWARESTEGLNYSRLRTCIAEQKTLQEVQGDKRVGRRHGVGGTPTVYVNGRKAPTFRFSAVKRLIQQELQ
ncbi:MAG: DsbA family protein [Candidatus Nanohaloarchaea archaeon]|nr:DsbA family protein [Candidatus Nanohaloarchaea archaeon]